MPFVQYKATDGKYRKRWEDAPNAPRTVRGIGDAPRFQGANGKTYDDYADAAATFAPPRNVIVAVDPAATGVRRRKPKIAEPKTADDIAAELVNALDWLRTTAIDSINPHTAKYDTDVYGNQHPKGKMDSPAVRDRIYRAQWLFNEFLKQHGDKTALSKTLTRLTKQAEKVVEEAKANAEQMRKDAVEDIARRSTAFQETCKAAQNRLMVEVEARERKLDKEIEQRVQERIDEMFGRKASLNRPKRKLNIDKARLDV